MGLIPLFIVLVSIAAPIALAGSSKPRRALKWLQIGIACFALVWAFLCLSVYPVYVLPE
jgi:hypothetical protein